MHQPTKPKGNRRDKTKPTLVLKKGGQLYDNLILADSYEWVIKKVEKE